MGGRARASSWPAHATVDVTGGLDAAQRAFEACDRGEPAVGFGEIYIQTGYDPTPAPEGHHLLSVFGQYAPYELAEGDWDARRDEVARQFIDLIDRFAPGLRGHRSSTTRCSARRDIEERIGLTGGNIFQGEVTPGPDVGRTASRRARRSRASTSAARRRTPAAA